VRVTDYLSALLPLLVPLALTLIGLGFLERLRETPWAWIYSSLFRFALLVWTVPFVMTARDVYQKHEFQDRRRQVADAISRELREGRSILDAIETDKAYQYIQTCNRKEVLRRYESRVEAWKERVQKLLDEFLPASGARRRFESVPIRFPLSQCPRMDYTYWRTLALFQNLSAIWEALDQYCFRIGPTCHPPA